MLRQDQQRAEIVDVREGGAGDDAVAQRAEEAVAVVVRHQLSARIRTFVDFLVERFGRFD
jgi:hypothetical protein